MSVNNYYYIDVCVSHSQGSSQAFENCDETLFDTMELDHVDEEPSGFARSGEDLGETV